jgi:glycosyltransferase involved in cell wall biosynthesis
MARAVAPRRLLRVLFVTGASAPEISSGGLQCQMVARVLDGQVAFRVLTTAVDPALPRRSIVDGVSVSRIAIDVRSARSKAQAAWRMVWQLVALLRDTDVVHVHGHSQKTILVAAMARLFKVPLAFSLHTAGFDEPSAIVRQGRLAQWAFNAADVYLPVSPSLVDACVAAGVPRGRIQQVPNGVDVARFHPAESNDRRNLRNALGIPPDRPVVLFVGFFSQEKQPQLLVDAWLRLQCNPATASTLVLIGATRSTYFEIDDRLAGQIRDSARQAGVADCLMLVEPTSQIDEYFRAADIFVLPSSREGLPVVLLEAMASGLPAVASRLAGSTDRLIDEGRTGLLVTPGDVAAFASAIGKLLSEPERASAIGRAARQRVVDDFSAERTARGWLGAYRQLVPTFA